MNLNRLILVLGLVVAGMSTSHAAAPLHLDLEMTGAEYAKILLQRRPRALRGSDAQALQKVLDLGKRNLDWLNFINQHRDEAHHLSLTSKETQNAFPIDQPREYNVAIVLKMYDDLLASIPEEMKQVLVGGSAFTEQPPIAELDYRTWGRKTDVVYQLGARWLLLSPYMDSYIQNRARDVRGYYYLNQEANLAQELANWTSLSVVKKGELRTWLIEICGNTDDYAQCGAAVDSAAKAGSLQAFFDQYFSASKELYDSFFTMQWSRTDIVWNAAHPEVLHIPFVDPKLAGVISYLRDNIEDEWKWTNWNLRLDFQEGSDSTMSHLRFEAGVTPHVDLPNTIVMDQNQPTTEYDSQWTIRHEFGHILGFPDCYVEFYDQDRAMMVSYQLDITNLMCSRRGAFKQTHFDELKRTYFKN